MCAILTARRAWACLALVGCSASASPVALRGQEARLGGVAFQTSVAGEPRESFLLGLGYLHSFEYADAATAFRAAQQARPDFAMAYWGEALTHNHPLWGQEDPDAARAVLARLDAVLAEYPGAVTEREAAYIAAARVLFGAGSKAERDSAYERSMGRLAAAYPDDEDASAFHALAILGAVDDRDHATYMRAAAIAEGVLSDHPRHPGALHYAIHAYDDPVHAGLGLRPARAYAEVAPDASHALHMPSHIFFALGSWEDVIRSNERAWEVSVTRAERLGLTVAQHNFHALYWLHYARLQAGDYAGAEDALAIAEAASAEGASTGGRAR